ncbi:MAG: OmpA family protein [Deltaproteobacteria bacterium]|nr:OmpA family protein [Deltaproteobacteria bacterium]
MKRWLLTACLALTQLAWTQYYTSNGIPIRWYEPEVTVLVDGKGTADVDGDGEFAAILTSLATWNDVDCPHPLLVDKGTVSGAVPGEKNKDNLVIWEDETQWIHVDRPKVIALTTLYFNDATGEVAKFDMEFADHKFIFTVTDDPLETHTDVENTVTHEMGHVLGLDHSSVAEATMYYQTDQFFPFAMRSLHEDDIDGLCTIYGPLNLPDGQDPPDGYSWLDGGPWVPPGGSGNGSCSADPSAHGTGPGAGWLVVVFLAFGLMLRRVPWACGLLAFLVAFPAAADSPLDIRVRDKVLQGKGRPALIVSARSGVRRLGVRLLQGDRTVRTYGTSDLRAGRTREFPIDQAPGKREYRAEIRWKGQDQPEVISFSAVVARPMAIRISRDTVDLSEGRIAFSASEKLARVELTILGESGTSLLVEDRAMESPAGAVTTVRFEPPDGKVTLVRLTAYDPWGFYNGVEIAPFFVEVPHEQVNFEFGKALIRPSEEPKLRRTLTDIRKALKKLASEFRARLYVAGYTDTVGSHESNRELSNRRARSIASWFLSNGLEVRVCYQGFGEGALAVPTPDDTPEPGNRRTVHVLANQTPPPSRTFPGAAWKCL